MINWEESVTLETLERYKIDASLGFSKFHAKLLDICFGHYTPSADKVQRLNDSGMLDPSDIEKLAFMVLVEFASSVEKQRTGTVEETQSKAEPRPYDVFVMKTSFGAQSSNIAVVLPLRKGKLAWWYGQDEKLEPLQNDLHVYRLASLSGSARVLECLDRVLRGGGALSAAAMERQWLFEAVQATSSSTDPHGHWDSPDTLNFDPSILDALNESQARAVRTVADEDFQDGFFAIQGPPGCGKTTTMVGMISAIGAGMVVAAPSNAAVANLGIKIVATNRFPFPEVCVSGDGCDESVRFLNPRHRSDACRKAVAEFARLRRQEIKPGPDAEKEALKRDRNMDHVRKGLATWLHVSEDLSMGELQDLCPNIELDETGKSVSTSGKRKLERILGDSKVILCTLNSSASNFLQNAVSRANFRTFLLDEGGQCTESEFFLATTFPGIKRIVVMGDPKQLPPTVLEPACSRAGFGNTWLGNVFELFPSKVHLLDTQYRMHPDILRFPNNQFYMGRIQSGDNVMNRYPHVRTPFSFIDTHGRGREELVGKSYRNSYEVAVIMDILKNDTDITTLLQANERARIIIITPYKSQVVLLQQMTCPLKSHNLEVSTVDSFQGQEGDVVILSTVRTQKVGFTDNGQRLNVALTRAKRVLRVVGDIRFFERQGNNSTLRALARHAQNGGFMTKTKMRRIASCPPDLSISTLWKITLTQRFHNAIALLDQSSKYVAMNTLVALALPDFAALGNRVQEKVRWHTTYLKGYQDLRVIWIARDHDGMGVIEAHHVGSVSSCLLFRQKNHILPDGCRTPLSDMSGLVSEQVNPPENGRMFSSWPLDSQLQDAILSDNLENLPLSKIQLDPRQEGIARSPPPLLIESRSGTGKTLVSYMRWCE
jgi:AAA domain